MRTVFFIAIRRRGKQWRCVAKTNDVEEALNLRFPGDTENDFEVSISALAAMTPLQVAEYNAHLAGKKTAPSYTRKVVPIARERWTQLLDDAAEFLET